jgi:hypothetical protein
MWYSLNATSCTASGDWSGSKLATLNMQTESVTAPSTIGTYTYTLECTGLSGTTTENSTISVVAGSGSGTGGGTGTGGVTADYTANICTIPGQNTPRQVEIVSLCQAAKLIRDVVVGLRNSEIIYKPMLATTQYLSNQLVSKLTNNLTQGEINNEIVAMIITLHMELVNQSAYPAFTKTLQAPVNTTFMMLDIIHKDLTGVGYQ